MLSGKDLRAHTEKAFERIGGNKYRAEIFLREHISDVPENAKIGQLGTMCWESGLQVGEVSTVCIPSDAQWEALGRCLYRLRIKITETVPDELVQVRLRVDGPMVEIPGVFVFYPFWNGAKALKGEQLLMPIPFPLLPPPVRYCIEITARCRFEVRGFWAPLEELNRGSRYRDGRLNEH